MCHVSRQICRCVTIRNTTKIAMQLSTASCRQTTIICQVIREASIYVSDFVINGTRSHLPFISDVE